MEGEHLTAVNVPKQCPLVLLERYVGGDVECWEIVDGEVTGQRAISRNVAGSIPDGVVGIFH